MSLLSVVYSDISNVFNYYTHQRESIDEPGVLGDAAFYPVVNETLALLRLAITAPSITETPDDFIENVVNLSFSPMVVAASVTGAAKHSKICLGILAAAYLGSVYLRSGQNPENNPE